MTPLEKKKKEMELKRVTLAREELELKILEKQEEIAKLETHIDIQIKKEEELKQELTK